MKKTVKILTTIIMVVMILSVFANIALAEPLVDIPDTVNGGDGIKAIAGQIIALIRIIGSVVAVGILVVLGIKYMMASAEGKADFKSSMIPYLVGAVLVFAGSWIASAIAEAIMGIAGN